MTSFTRPEDGVPPHSGEPNQTPKGAPSAARIHEVIRRYAKVYAALLDLQERSPLIPIGDQKTGSIGEFYVRLYLEERYRGARITFGGHSESGWDLEVSTAVRTWRVQVKTVSAFATMRRISPIKRGWEELHVIHLDRSFSPSGFWVIEDSTSMGSNDSLKNRCCPNPATGTGGSRGMNFGPNRVAELMALIRGRLQLQE